MKTPVVFLDGIIFPGLPGEVPISELVADQLEAFWEYMGFGTLDVALAFGARDGAPAGPENFCGVGTLAEVTVERGDAGASIVIHGGHRVSLGRLRPPSTGATGWGGHTADPEPAVAGSEALEHHRLNSLQRGFFSLLLTRPHEVDIHAEGIRRVLTDTMVELEQRASAAKVCYLLADFLVEESSARREILEDSALLDSVETVEGLLAAKMDSSAEDPRLRHHNFLDFIEQILVGGVRDSIDGLDCARRMAGLGLVSISEGALDELAGLRETLDQVADMMQGLVDDLGDEGP